MTENERFISLVCDKIRKTENAYMLTRTNFLNLSERSLAASVCKENGAKFCFWGGYPDAERTVLFLLPDYMEADEKFPSEEDNPLCLLQCKTPSGAKKLTHRDYLGSLLALGIEREIIGDILVRENGADIIILKSIADYLLSCYEKAGTVPIKCEIQPIENLVPPEQKTVTVRESVASVRLDCVIGAAFGFSRTAACEHIAKGLVFVNDNQASKPDAKLNIGDKIVVRGFGKAYFKEIGGTTRKGRISVLFEKYV
ncbi:MAG: RNA-binding protein [Clostridia bacterium]|nr:RNA-binding protein [Clostridia bacterium]